MTNTYDVITIGNAMVDEFLTMHNANEHLRLDPVKHELCISYGDKINVEKLEMLLGGNAANVAVGLSRLLLKTGIFAEIGSDELALKITNSLAREQVDKSWLRQTPGEATSVSVAINFQGDRTLFVEHVLRKHDFRFDDVAPRWIYLTSLGKEWIHAYENVLTIVQEKNIHLAFNPGSQQLERGNEAMVKKVITHTDILFVNKEEAQYIVQGSENQETAIKELMERLQQLGAKQIVITDGKNGSYATDASGSVYHLESFPCAIIERTGAGDAYSSGFLAATYLGKSTQEGMQWGSVEAASVIEAVGAETGLLTQDAIQSKLSENKEFVPQVM